MGLKLRVKDSLKVGADIDKVELTAVALIDELNEADVVTLAIGVLVLLRLGLALRVKDSLRVRADIEMVELAAVPLIDPVANVTDSVKLGVTLIVALIDTVDVRDSEILLAVVDIVRETVLLTEDSSESDSEIDASVNEGVREPVNDFDVDFSSEYDLVLVVVFEPYAAGTAASATSPPLELRSERMHRIARTIR